MDHNFSESLITRKEAVVSSKGIVASQHKLASRAGAKVLAEGGNAVDAAVATAFTVSVLEPWMSGIGGGGHMLIHDAPSGKVHAIDFGMRSPIGLDPEDYPLSGEGVASDLFPWPRVVEDRNIVGATSIAVPGQVDGMRVALENFGSRSWKESLQPAIQAAEAGMQIDWYATLLIGSAAAELNHYPCTRETYLVDGHPPAPPWTAGAVPRKHFPYLTKTLKHLAEAGPRDFYEGRLASTLVEDISRCGGILSREDLEKYQAKLVEPLVREYRNTRLHVHPELNAGSTLLKALSLLKQPLETEKAASAEAFLAIAEALDQVYQERLETMGDVPGGRDMSCTTHLCVIDSQGSMVSLTQTLLSIFGSKLVLPQTGILMNNGLMWFNPEPGHPNSLAPDKRCLANTCPVIGLNDSGGMALGASGGRRIMPAVLQLLHLLIDGEMSLEEAFHQPRIDHSGGDQVVVDRRLQKEVLQKIQEKFSCITAENGAFPLYFACPSAVLKNGSQHYGSTAITHPWADAVSED
mgnify:FL=1